MKSALVLLGLISLLPGCSRLPYVFEIPEGYIGWVRVQFDIRDCPKLLKRDGKLILRIGNDGRLCTSSVLEIGAPFDEYYYVGKSATRLSQTELHGGGMIWGGGVDTITWGTNKEVSRAFYVGTEMDFRNQHSSQK